KQPMIRDIRAGADVRALIGAETLQRLHAGACRSYGCATCGRPGATTEPATVTAERGPAAVRVTLSHAACAPPRGRYVDAARVPAGIARMRCLPAILGLRASAAAAGPAGFRTRRRAVRAHAGRRAPRPGRIAPPRLRLRSPRCRRPDA